MSESGMWQSVLGEAEVSLSRGNYVTWFKKTTLLGYTPEEAVIGVPNVFIKQQMERRYSDYIADLLEKNGTRPKNVRFEIYTAPGAKKAETTRDTSVPREPQETKDTSSKKQRSGRKTSSSGVSHAYRLGLNSKYTFDNFIVGSSNELAYAACQSIAATPGQKYNPLFLYGGVGIGKTHLIQAVGNEIVKINPSAHIVYISSEQFVQEFLDAIRFKKNTDFAGYYRSADVLIVDDIQFIAGKEKTQEEFFHTFNALHQANKQIIISSDRPPRDIPTLEERLRSRFTWGMAIDMQTPDFETRCAIVQTKASQQSLELEPDVVELLANAFRSNIRELEGALNQLIVYCETHGLTPNTEVAESILSSADKRPRHLTARQVVDVTARYFSVDVQDLMSPKRDKEIVVPRQIAMHLLRSELKLSFPKIARECGRKDHTTAMHSVEKIQKALVLDPSIRQQVTELKGLLYA